MNKLIEEITIEMQDYKFYLASEKIYHYVWHEFADKIIEECKVLFNTKNAHDSAIKSCKQYLIFSLINILKIL